MLIVDPEILIKFKKYALLTSFDAPTNKHQSCLFDVLSIRTTEDAYKFGPLSKQYTLPICVINVQDPYVTACIIYGDNFQLSAIQKTINSHLQHKCSNLNRGPLCLQFDILEGDLKDSWYCTFFNRILKPLENYER